MTATVNQRRRAGQDFRRAQILAAARALLGRDPPVEPTVRAIADAVGYTPGALYSYFPSKQDLQGALVAELLAEVGRAVRRSAAEARDPQAAVRAAARTLFHGLRAHRAETGIILRFLDGPVDELTSSVDRQLNGRLIGMLAPIAEALIASGFGTAAANRATVMLLGQVVGLLVLDLSGRLGTLGQSADDLLDRQLEMQLARPGQQGDTA